MNLAASLPKGEGNGLGAITRELLDDPHHVHVVVALVDCKSTKVDHETGDRKPTIRVKRIEVLAGDDLETARELLERAYNQRSGSETLPFELQEDLNAAFGGDDS